MSFSSSTTRLFVSCAGALEALLAQELKELGLSNIEAGFRGVFAPKTMDAVYRVNYASRIATRVLWPLLSFPCPDRQALYQAALSIDWSLYLRPDKTFSIDANLDRHPTLKNSHFAALVVKDAICDQQRNRFGNRSSIDLKNPDVQLNLFIHQGKATLYFDTSLQPLYKRGYRLKTGEAPLQESLAAALLHIAGYDPQKHVLCDPFAGSGTLLIEAAMMATKTPAGIFRKSWGFQAMPEFSQQAWNTVRHEFEAKKISLPSGRIFGADSDVTMIEISRDLFARTGFSKEIEIYTRPISRFRPPAPPQLIVSNPPYGQRLERSEYLDHDFEKFLVQHLPLSAFFLSPANKQSQIPHRRVLSCLNGGLEVDVLQYLPHK
ncbi:MAG: 50S rRNA methyltransferase [Simkania sp.]|nr:50S rRNA methyltransferase [Simkania sp.]